MALPAASGRTDRVDPPARARSRAGPAGRREHERTREDRPSRDLGHGVQ
ncbi:hypothetical protein SAMN02745121_01440 [Nannocystis exedens]|uniref:Uncharacterized protein n=1 Tax=Nannocystis exedens TaxID=54 RepID=A0A1I1UZT3_9BACT|nr:hypothetical protein NAEX_05319 [Nannocystis exedens]SFD76286.1 hypothetical protein SAMN02745121_01440 [Nannocystis exedens]